MLHRRRKKPQFTLRSLLAGTTWAALLIAVCVAHQQAARRQRTAIEALKAARALPLTVVCPQSMPLRTPTNHGPTR
jgi:hypothetical protein